MALARQPSPGQADCVAAHHASLVGGTQDGTHQTEGRNVGVSKFDTIAVLGASPAADARCDPLGRDGRVQRFRQLIAWGMPRAVRRR